MKKGFLYAFIFTMLLAVIGCSKSSEVEETNQIETNTEANDQEAAGEEISDEKEAAEVEEEVKDETANAEEEVTDLAQSEMRVVASSVAVVEILDQLGIPMVGVPTSSYELPASVAEATRIGNPMSPDMEIIASLEPSVVISVSSLSQELKTQFETMGMENQFADLTSYDGLKKSIADLGTYFGVEDKAAEIIAGFDAKEAEVLKNVEGKESPSVLIVFGAAGSFMVATENTYVGDLVKRVGGTNVLSGVEGAFIPVDMEFLADKNPEYILFMAHANPEESLEAFRKEFETNEAWQNFDAVVNNKTISLDLSYFGMSANLLATDAMEKLVNYIYAE